MDAVAPHEPSPASVEPGWPAEELEHLGRCPLCGGSRRELAYGAVRDGVFGAAGAWDYYRCACGVLYLDPRPTPASIHRAYRSYYTHEPAVRTFAWRAPGFRGAIRRGYLNARYGYALADAARLGGLTWRLREPSTRNLDFMIRHLAAPSRGGGRVLDVGCGNGDFLRVAADLGFDAAGIDPDPRSVELAQAQGLAVRLGSLPGSKLEPAGFDHLFLSHVLEHLHEPAAALAEAGSLLAPGGRLWISLPNLDAPGLNRFGRHWRGLEPPRHLALFTMGRLREALADSGLERIEVLPAEEAALVYYRQSQAIAKGLDPCRDRDPPGWIEEARKDALSANRFARREPLKGESLTLVAWRPR